LCPRLQRDVPVVRGGLEDDAALVVRAALRGRERPAQELALLGRLREVLLRREVVPAELLGRATACKIQRVGDRAVAVAGGAARGALRLRGRRADDGLHLVAERAEVGPRRILGDVEV